MKVLVTGGAGFIGSHLVEHFLSLGNQVVSLDNYSTGSTKNIKSNSKNLLSIDGDIRDASLIEKLIENSDVVLHMAAALGVANIMNSTLESISVNFIGSEVVLKAAAKAKKRIIIASTSEIYGKNPKQPLAEEDDRVVGNPQNFRWTYSDAKALEEASARVLYLSHNLPVTTLRFFNTVGPRQTGKYGMVLPRFIESALAGESIKVHGDGKQSRVFCHVLDVIDAVSRVIDNEETLGEVYNVGGEGEISILNLAKKVKDLTKSSSPIEFVPYRDAYPEGFEDIERRVPDTKKIRSLTGWEPKLGIDQIILDIVQSKI